MTYLDEVHEQTVISMGHGERSMRPTLRARVGAMIRPRADHHLVVGLCRCDICALRRAERRFA